MEKYFVEFAAYEWTKLVANGSYEVYCCNDGWSFSAITKLKKEIMEKVEAKGHTPTYIQIINLYPITSETS